MAVTYGYENSRPTAELACIPDPHGTATEILDRTRQQTCQMHSAPATNFTFYLIDWEPSKRSGFRQPGCYAATALTPDSLFALLRPDMEFPTSGRSRLPAN